MPQNLVYTLQQPHQENLAATQEFIETLADTLPREVQQALVVRFSDQTNMFGETFKDTLTQRAAQQEARYSVQVHPYPWLAAGASNVIFYQNIFQELAVALVYNQRRDKRPVTDPLRLAKVPDFFKLPEGYMHPKPCSGGEQGIFIAPHVDEAEEMMLKGVAMSDAYKMTKESTRSENAPVSSTFDTGIKACAVRECFEEVGLAFAEDQAHYISQYEDNRMIPMIVNIYMFKAKHKEISPPTLRVDGTEIGDGVWGKLHAFQLIKDPTKPQQFYVALDYYDEEGHSYLIEVPLKYATMIGQATQKFREDEIKKTSQLDDTALFSSREHVEARLKQTLKSKILNPERKTCSDILGISPESHLQTFANGDLPADTEQERREMLIALSQLGKIAADYHKKILSLATAFKNMPADAPLSVMHLQAVATDAPAIEKSLLASKVRLFPLSRMHPPSTDDANEEHPSSLIWKLNPISW